MSKIKIHVYNGSSLDVLNSRGSLPWITPPESLSLPALLAWEPNLSLLFCPNHPIQLIAMEQMNAVNLCLGPRIHWWFVHYLAWPLSIGFCVVLNDTFEILSHLTFISFVTVWNNQIQTYDSPLIMLTDIPCYTYLSRRALHSLCSVEEAVGDDSLRNTTSIIMGNSKFLHSYFCRTVNI
jgi:hypothetical protein